MGVNVPAQHNLGSAGQLRAHLMDDACNVPGYSAQVARLNRAEDGDDGPYVVVGDDRRPGSALDGSDAREKGRCDARRRPGNGHVCEILERVDAILRGLSRDVVADSILRVEPVCW